MHPNTQSTAPRPYIRCACCGAVMRADWQALPSGGTWLITCDTPAERCDLAAHTLSVDNYPPANMQDYLTSGRQRRLAALAAAVEGLQA